MLVVMGASAGGMLALRAILTHLPVDFNAPILIVQHMLPSSDDLLIKMLLKSCQLKIQYALNGQEPEQGKVYLAPPDYHLRLDADGIMMTSTDEKIMFSRPSIDALFHSVSQLNNHHVIGVILTGANSDGAKGAKAILQHGGELIVQAPETAEVDIMPKAALKICGDNHSVWLDQIASVLWDKVNKRIKNN